MKNTRHLLLAGALAALFVAGAWWGSPRAGGESAQGERPCSARGVAAVAWPSREHVWRVLSLADHNTRVVFAGVSALGAAGGLVGTFLLLRKRSLLSDTVSHCTLPGIAMAFLLTEAAGVSGRGTFWLLVGAAVTGVLGMATVSAICRHTRVRDDAALAIVLSVYFGLGIALLVAIQQLPTANAAGLSQYIYGKAAAMTAADAGWILAASGLAAVVCAAFLKEFTLLCFDEGYARTQGWPTWALDFVLMGLVAAVTVIGLQAVGLLLVVALLIVPAAAARFWSQRLGATVALAAVIGAASGLIGAAVTALFPRLPAGAVIVLAAVTCFLFSLVFGAERGLWRGWWEQRRVRRRVERQHLLRAIYEWCEGRGSAVSGERAHFLDAPAPTAELRRLNDWSAARWRRLRRLGFAEGLLAGHEGDDAVRLTAQGKLEARRVTRNHRLWETYLLRYADVAPQHLHHNADQIEHVIDPRVLNELEELLAGREGATLVPAEPGRGSARPQGGVGV